MTRELNLLYVHSESMGYGRMGVYLAREIERLGISVYDHLPGQTDFGSMEFDKPGHSKVCNLACWVSVPSHAKGWVEGQHTACYTMWEANRLPESFRENMHEFDTIIVPSYQNLEMFSAYHDNVHFIPLGFDPDLWHYQPVSPPEDEFRFLIGGSGPRKGTDLAFKAFKKVFKTYPKDGPVPILQMKNPRGEPQFAGFDRVQMIPGKIPAQAEVDLYADAHCYLQPSRGEGFGLQPLQAIATGRPTILTAAHGHDAFAHLGYGLDSTLVPAAYFLHGHAGEWWEPDLDQLCEYMEYVFNNYEDAAALAQDNAEKAKEFTWAKMAERFVGLLGEHMVPYSGSGKWHDADTKRYHVRVFQPWKAEVAGTHYYFEPGKDYWEPADIKRILFDSNKLDPSCLNTTLPDGTEVADIGLNEKELSLIPNYSASHGYCPHCQQKFGSGTTKADEIFEELEAAANAR